MRYTDWTISTEGFEPEKRQSRDALFTVGNGYMGIRGFFEEDAGAKIGNGGMYVSGIFGAGSYDAWEGRSRESFNIPHVFRLNVYINGNKLDGTTDVTDCIQTLNIKEAVYTRQYNYQEIANIKTERFADRVCINRAAQRVNITAVEKPLDVVIEAVIDSDVCNLNLESCEPLPIQPGRNHIINRDIRDDVLKIYLDDDAKTSMSFCQKTYAFVEGKAILGENFKTDYAYGTRYSCVLNVGENLNIEKLIYLFTSKDWDKGESGLSYFQQSNDSYESVLEKHIAEWEKRWQDADIEIDTDTNDKTAVRYDIFELMCACPEHTDRLSIGARGLTGEMYEGCVFWDNEIFQLPFFIYTNPSAARKLLLFRYHTLEAAKRHAKNNWFDGAMYPWQVSETGIEQTPYNVGAFYAIHIVADITYAVSQYCRITGDDSILFDGALEIVVETARFWASRADYSERDGHYHIRAVRGPNEYDIFVNDNAYTNVMASENIKFALYAIDRIKQNYGNQSEKLLKKASVTKEECQKWQEIAKRIIICREGDLVLEDAGYLERRPLDLKRAKPTDKRIIDSTMPYEALSLYQITKQSDTVTLMCLQPDLFSDIEKKKAYDFYEPRTAHDSSLSYAPYGLMAAKLGKKETAYDYFNRCAYLDIKDLKLNSVSGLHFANFGGTWQVIVFGFMGIEYIDGMLHISPNLPSKWQGIKTSLIYRGIKLNFAINNSCVTVSSDNIVSEVELCICGKNYILSKQNKIISAFLL